MNSKNGLYFSIKDFCWKEFDYREYREVFCRQEANSQLYTLFHMHVMDGYVCNFNLAHLINDMPHICKQAHIIDCMMEKDNISSFVVYCCFLKLRILISYFLLKYWIQSRCVGHEVVQLKIVRQWDFIQQDRVKKISLGKKEWRPFVCTYTREFYNGT